MGMPLKAKQLIKSTTSMFFFGWERQFNKNGGYYRQLVTRSFIRTCPLMHRVSCRAFGETQVTQLPLQPRFGTLWLLDFPDTKIVFEREEISDHLWDSVKPDGAANNNSNRGFCRVFWTVEETLGTLWGSKVPTWKGTVVSYVQHFLVSCIFFQKCLYFHNTWLDTFRADHI